MPNLSVIHQAADRFELQVRGHRLLCDQPPAAGGDDQGPTPTELFVGSLAACVAFYARRFLARHDLDTTGPRVEADFTHERRPPGPSRHHHPVAAPPPAAGAEPPPGVAGGR